MEQCFWYQWARSRSGKFWTRSGAGAEWLLNSRSTEGKLLPLYSAHILWYPLIVYEKHTCQRMTITPKFRKCWDVFFIWIKLKLKDFQTTWANILFTIEYNKSLNGQVLHFYTLNELISNLMPVISIKNLTRRQQRFEKARHFEKIQLGEHLATN